MATVALTIPDDELAILNKRHQSYGDEKTGGNAFRNYILYEAKCHVDQFCKDNLASDRTTDIAAVKATVDLSVASKIAAEELIK